jgi:nitrite reductase/ring-hydroxylating ferredoxin subunit
VATAKDLERQSVLAVEAGGEEIALYWVEGAPYATSNICTHALAHLTDGFLDGECVECPIHQAMFNVKSGEVVAGPAEAPVKTYPCRIEGVDVVIDV